jgi:hypothetical protein
MNTEQFEETRYIIDLIDCERELISRRRKRKLIDKGVKDRG